jgi:putative ABC transport system permease protein
MAIPLTYNLRSLRVRWVSALVTVVGIAGAVGVFLAMLSLRNGFRATLVSSGSPQNSLVLRAGSTSEMGSAVTLDQVRIIENAPGVQRNQAGPLVSPEVVAMASFPLKNKKANANTQLRGVSPLVLSIRDHTHLIAGRFFTPGLNELVIGRNIASTYDGFELGRTVNFGGVPWTVVGTFDSGGSAFDSEVWCDANALNQAYKRQPNIFQSVTVRLTSVTAYAGFKDALSSDPRFNVQVDREIDYYNKQSGTMSAVILGLGSIITVVIGIGAIFAAVNTTYSSVVERAREIATLRAVGFKEGSVVSSFLIESLCLALMGGVAGCIAVLPLNGLTTGAMNWATFSHVTFAFRTTPLLLGYGIIFALCMGVLGAAVPALRAAQTPIASGLREL